MIGRYNLFDGIVTRIVDTDLGLWTKDFVANFEIGTSFMVLFI